MSGSHSMGRSHPARSSTVMLATEYLRCAPPSAPGIPGGTLGTTGREYLSGRPRGIRSGPCPSQALRACRPQRKHSSRSRPSRGGIFAASGRPLALKGLALRVLRSEIPSLTPLGRFVASSERRRRRTAVATPAAGIQPHRKSPHPCGEETPRPVLPRPTAVSRPCSNGRRSAILAALRPGQHRPRRQIRKSKDLSEPLKNDFDLDIHSKRR